MAPKDSPCITEQLGDGAGISFRGTGFLSCGSSGHCSQKQALTLLRVTIHPIAQAFMFTFVQHSRKNHLFEVLFITVVFSLSPAEEDGRSSTLNHKRGKSSNSSCPVSREGKGTD